MIDKMKRAGKIWKNEGFTSLFWKASQFSKRKVRQKALNQSLTGSETYLELCQKGFYNRPHYGFCAYWAGKQAKNLGFDEVSLIEFGVAGGNGLVNLENHVSRLEQRLDISYEIYGFDTGEGMPSPESPKDTPYMWSEGDYEMDIELLESRLNRSELILGDVENTLPDFTSNYEPAPIGGVYFDLDYYSSTKKAFDILNVDDKFILPRVPMYFDDVLLGNTLRMTIPQVGEAQAIKEYNKNNKSKIGKLQFKHDNITNNVLPKRQYAYHRFEHDLYTKNIREKENRQLPLTLSD